MNDPILDEIRKYRDEHAARFNYDLHAIYLDIKRREKERGLVFVDGVARQPQPKPAVVQPATPVTPDVPSSPVASVTDL